MGNGLAEQTYREVMLKDPPRGDDAAGGCHARVRLR